MKFLLPSLLLEQFRFYHSARVGGFQIKILVKIAISSTLARMVRDTVLADRGFTIADDLAIHCVKLEIPAITWGKGQLSQKDVELSKQLPKVRIHVEQVNGHLKILSQST